MESKGQLSKFNTDDNNISQNKNTLNISENFIQLFDLHSFLVEHILGHDFELKYEGKQIDINSTEDLVKIIVEHLKSKKYIGVGVGGVYIHNIESEPSVLLYKRYHEPENQQWSILGGSSRIHEKIEDTLIRKINRLTNISRDSISVKDIIRANNHDEQTFHYLSPAFYVDIKNPNTYLYWGNQTNKKGNKKKVEIINHVDDFSKLGESTYKNPLLAWVPVKMITGDLTDIDGDQIFSFTTIQAIESHRHIYDETLKVVQATETVKSYRDWRLGKS